MVSAVASQIKFDVMKEIISDMNVHMLVMKIEERINDFKIIVETFGEHYCWCWRGLVRAVNLL